LLDQKIEFRVAVEGPPFTARQLIARRCDFPAFSLKFFGVGAASGT
jgi:hypothetical protein